MPVKTSQSNNSEVNPKANVLQATISMKQEYHLYLLITHAALSAIPSSLNVRIVNPNSHPTP